MSGYAKKLTPTIVGRLALGLALLWWQGRAARLGCPETMLVLVLFWGLSLLAASEAAFYRRHAFITRFLVSSGWLFRMLKRGLLLLVWNGVKSLFLALLLLVAALTLNTVHWAVLLGDTLVLTALEVAFARLLHTEVIPLYQGPLFRSWAMRLNALLLWTTLTAVTLFSAQENFTGMHWEAVAHYGAAQVEAGCDVMGMLGRLNSAGEALAFWAGQNLLAGLEQPSQTVVGWLVLLSSFGVSFLIAWAYSRALSGIAARPWQLWQDQA